MAGSIDRARFVALLVERFPEIAAEIDECRAGLLHLEMGVLASATQEAIDRNDRATILAHFHFVDELFRDAAPDVENAIYVSYLEDLRFDGRKAAPAKARELLTPRLKQAHADLEKYLDELFRK